MKSFLGRVKYGGLVAVVTESLIFSLMVAVCAEVEDGKLPNTARISEQEQQDAEAIKYWIQQLDTADIRAERFRKEHPNVQEVDSHGHREKQKLVSYGELAVPFILEVLDEVRHPGKMIEVLGEIGDKRAAPKLLSIIKDPASELHYTAADALAEIDPKVGGPILIEFLRPKLRSKDSSRRASAIFRLGPIARKEEIPLVLAALSDDDLNVRQRAVGTLRLATNHYFGYEQRGPEEKRNEAISRWQEWWEANREKTQDEWIRQGMAFILATLAEPKTGVRKMALHQLRTYARMPYYGPASERVWEKGSPEERAKEIEQWKAWWDKCKSLPREQWWKLTLSEIIVPDLSGSNAERRSLAFSSFVILLRGKYRKPDTSSRGDRDKAIGNALDWWNDNQALFSVCQDKRKITSGGSPRNDISIVKEWLLFLKSELTNIEDGFSYVNLPFNFDGKLVSEEDVMRSKFTEIREILNNENMTITFRKFKSVNKNEINEYLGNCGHSNKYKLSSERTKSMVIFELKAIFLPAGEENIHKVFIGLDINKRIISWFD